MRAFRILPTPVIQAASLSPEALKRFSWIDWYFSHGKNAELTCRHFGIAKSVFYRWFNRFDRNNLRTLEFDTKTRRPHKVREMTTPEWLQKRIYDIRFNDVEKSKYEIQAELRDEGISVGRKCIQKIINRHPELLNTQHRKKMKKRKRRHIARMKAETVLRDQGLGSLVQMDTKYFYVLGRKFYLFSAIDCASRYGFVYCYKTISSTSGRDFLRRVKDYFPFQIHAVNTDNGSEYLLHFHHELEKEWRIPHYFTDPHCPKQNGRVERFHQTVEYEYFNYQEDLLDDIDMINTHCILLNTKYNTKRYHRSLGYRTPQQAMLEYLKEKGGQPFSI
ncbi:MAG: transposase [Candidatus Levybacteria bacterium]|nr:transposase [Candidatus Levybacteria bacterium]